MLKSETFSVNFAVFFNRQDERNLSSVIRKLLAFPVVFPVLLAK
jgi:hypothetical protein